MTISARSVTELLAKHLEVDRAKVVPTARLLEDLGASPLTLVHVALALEQRFDIRIGESEVESFVTVEDVMACVASARHSRDAGRLPATRPP